MDGKDKNIYIECLRFLFIIAICLHHFRMYSAALPYAGGYVATDFMFIISGFFLCSHLERKKAEQKNESVLQYMKKRYLRLFPAQIAAIAMAFVARLCMGENITAKYAGGYLREAFMIEIACLNCADRLNPPDWYCGYLLAGTLAAYIFLKKVEWKGKYAVCGLVSVLCYIALCMEHGIINIIPLYSVVFSVSAFVRAAAGIFMGCFLCFIVRRYILGRRKRYLKLYWIPAGGIIFFIFYVLLWDNGFPYIDYSVIALFCILFLLLYMVELKISEKVQTIIKRLGQMTYIMFLNHYIIAFIFTKYDLLGTWDWKAASLAYLAAVLFISCILQYAGSVITLMGKRILSTYR